MTAKHRIIQVGSYAGSPTANERLARDYDVVELWKYPDRTAALAQQGKGIDVLVTSANFGCPAEMMDALPDLKAAIAYCESVGDYGSRELLEDILESEEEHIDWLETQLGLIEKVGLENYLQSQMDE